MLVTGVGHSIIPKSSPSLELDRPPLLDVSEQIFAAPRKISSLEDGDGRRGGQAIGIFKASTETFEN